MIYERLYNKIIIHNKTDFNSKHILECGQVFRYKILSIENAFCKISKLNNITNEKFTENLCELIYEVITLDKIAYICEYNEFYIIYCNNNFIDYFINYFDLNSDYSLIKQKLSELNIEILNKAINCCYGVRILNQNPYEVFINFLISSNNNIKRIQLIIEKLCVLCGENKGDYYAFPTLDKLKSLSLNDLRSVGLGYRAEYLYKNLQNSAFNITELNANSDNLKERLLNFYGVGDKVSECILLFGFHKLNYFPTDVWVQKLYNEYFDNSLTDRKLIAKNLVNTFKNLSGYAQQYLFYYKRCFDKC